MMNKMVRVAGSRTWAGVLLALLAVTAIAFGQVIENPAKPKAANAGRVVVPEEVLALIYTSEYLLKIYDPAADKVVREFRRAYERVKGAPLTEAEKQGGLIIDGKHYTRPEQKFENDVKNVLPRGDEIWTATSTKDKVKGILIDVFDGEGVYRDSFYLKLPEAAIKSIFSPGSCALDGDFLWVVERSEDETFVIKKYRVVI